jgi:hypothetical protein
MKRVVLLVTVLLLGSALAVEAQTTVVVGQPTAPAKYSGLAWTWDSERNIVTLYDSGRTFRVQTTPDQIARLNHHQQTTVTGTLLGPDPIETVLLPTQPMTAVASGPAASAEVAGHIAAIEANGVASIQSARGPLRVWVADGAQSRFAHGKPVKVTINVQPVRMVAVSGTGGQASGPTLAPPPSIPGDSAVVVGRVLAANPNGTLTIESPRGPLSIWVDNAANFRTGDFVQVHTVVQAAS